MDKERKGQSGSKNTGASAETVVAGGIEEAKKNDHPAKEVLEGRRVGIMETALRDAHQSIMAT
ncbi:MAG TPA: oxaloacetate decarboxylase subunit alpha, partial [Synergistaceae bacterium]|nr:oxaloacetate decarboxylase subunit alpha [Synergistaceae bacterium]HQK26072.1 oxaloacetate decarboxylase subunit alpha [Synergistaceae bacterium]